MKNKIYLALSVLSLMSSTLNLSILWSVFLASSFDSSWERFIMVNPLIVHFCYVIPFVLAVLFLIAFLFEKIKFIFETIAFLFEK